VAAGERGEAREAAAIVAAVQADGAEPYAAGKGLRQRG
jgi:hypothetical protein